MQYEFFISLHQTGTFKSQCQRIIQSNAGFSGAKTFANIFKKLSLRMKLAICYVA